MLNYPNTRAALRGLPRRIQQTVNAWLNRRIPRTAQILLDYPELYQALKSDLAGNPSHTS